MAENIFTLEELQKLGSYWQEKLGLSHWQIAVRIARARDLPEETDGCNDYQLETESAAISILDPVDYPEGPFEQDMEITLVHELLHIPMGYIANPEKESLEHIHLESTISRLARLLVMLKRGASDNG
jgi:hypothetical protein